MLEHTIGIFVIGHTAFPAQGFPNMGKGMHACCIHPAEKGLSICILPFNEINSGCKSLIIYGFHPLFGKRS
ncbi:hypothetical protein D3C87_1699960 [compost metagenome]